MCDFTELTEKFIKFKQHDKIIQTLTSDDYFKVATTTNEALHSISSFLPMVKRQEPKNPAMSHLYRQHGNSQYSEKNYSEALQAYNLALLYAPKNSQEEAFAYSNRSDLFTRIKKFSAALRDIDICLKLNISSYDGLSEKLKKRQEECLRMIWQEDVEYNNLLGDFKDTEMGTKFYELKGNRHPDYPFARNNVDLIMRDGVESIIAKSDIKIGELIAIETAFISSTLNDNRLINCYYCNCFWENLIPCDNCTYALFCSQDCRTKCWEEYHEFECNIIEIIKMLPQWYSTWFKYVIKTWTSSGRNIDSFAEASKKMEDYLLKGNLATKLNMDDLNTYTLPPRKNRIKSFGKLYDAAIYTALITHALKTISSEVFQTPFKMLFIEHAAKQLMFHALHSAPMFLSGSYITLEVGNEDGLIVNSIAGLGAFPFLSRLKHHCDSNTVTVGLGNRLVLICQKPIPAGTELTLAYAGQYSENTLKERRIQLHNLMGIICDCQPCIEDWKKLQEELARNEIEALMPLFFWTNDKNAKFKIICDIQGKLLASGLQGSKKYVIIYTMFRQILAFNQYVLRKDWAVGKASQLEKEEISDMLDCLKNLINGNG